MEWNWKLGHVRIWSWGGIGLLVGEGEGENVCKHAAGDSSECDPEIPSRYSVHRPEVRVKGLQAAAASRGRRC